MREVTLVLTRCSGLLSNSFHDHCIFGCSHLSLEGEWQELLASSLFTEVPGIATVSLKEFHDKPRRAARLNPTTIHLVWCPPSKYSFGKWCKKLHNDQIQDDLFSNLNSSCSVLFGYFTLRPKHMICMSPSHNFIIYFF